MRVTRSERQLGGCDVWRGPPLTPPRQRLTGDFKVLVDFSTAVVLSGALLYTVWQVAIGSKRAAYILGDI